MKLHFLAIFFLLSDFYYINAQNYAVIDSLNTTLIQTIDTEDQTKILDLLTWEYYRFKPDSGIPYCKKALYNSIKTQNLNDIAYYNSFLGVLFKNVSQYDSAEFYYKQAIKIHGLLKNKRGVAANYNNLGKVYHLKADYKNAVKYYYKARDIFDDEGDRYNTGEVYSNLGELMVSLKKYNQAKQFFLKAQSHYDLKHEVAKAVVISDLASLKLKNGEVDAALKDYKKAGNLFKQNNRMKNYAGTLLEIAKIQIQQDQTAQALELLNKSQVILEELNEKYILSLNYLLLGKVYFRMEDYEKAHVYSKKTKTISEKIGANDLLADAYFLLYSIFKIRKDWQNALEFHQKYVVIKDSIHDLEQKKIIKEIESKYELKDKEQEIQQLQFKNKLQKLNNEQNKLKLENQNRFSIVLLFAFAVVLVASLLLFRQSKIRKQLNSKLEIALGEREVLIKETHHRVKNNLQIISSLLSLQVANTQDKQAKLILQESQNRITTLAMIHEKLYHTKNLKNIDIQEYVNNLLDYLAVSFAFDNKHIDCKIEVQSYIVGIDILVSCGLILNELVTNAVKYAFEEDYSENKITITGKIQEAFYSIMVADNGKGLPENININKANTLGFRLVKGLSKQIGGNLEIASSENGTSIHFSFKL